MKKTDDIVVKAAVIKVMRDINPIQNPKMNAQTIAYTFMFPSGKPGTIMVTKITQGEWIPADDIREIGITFV